LLLAAENIAGDFLHFRYVSLLCLSCALKMINRFCNGSSGLWGLFFHRGLGAGSDLMSIIMSCTGHQHY
jgi:hypothetical protein